MMKKWLSIAITLLVLTGCQPKKDVTETTEAETSVVETSPASETEDKTTVAESATDASSKREINDSNSAEPEEIQVTVTIKVDDEVLVDKEPLDTATDISLLELMKKNYTLKEDKAFVTEIEGHSQNQKENRWWLYTVNGEMAEVGAAELYLENGDHVEWTLSSLD